MLISIEGFRSGEGIFVGVSGAGEPPPCALSDTDVNLSAHPAPITSSRFPILMTGIPDQKKAFLELQRHTNGFLCTTLGHEGAMALVDGEIVHFRGFPIKAVDTTGAGDVFHAGFIYGLLQNWEVEKIMKFANAAAALKCLDFGGRKGIPPIEETQKFLCF